MAVASTLPTDGVAPTPALRTATGTASPFPVDSPKTACPQESPRRLTRPPTGRREIRNRRTGAERPVGAGSFTLPTTGKNNCREPARVVDVDHLVIGYHMLLHGTDYADLGESYQDDKASSRTRRSLVRQLEALGFQVTLNKKQQLAA